MPPIAASPPAPPPFDVIDWFRLHSQVTLWLGAFALWISLCLILRLWLLHRRTHFLRKILWTFILLIPLFGWLGYAGLFTPLGFSNIDCPTENNWASSGDGGGGGHDSGGGGHH